MAINRLNHAVLYVRDAERSAAFYTDVLGFRVKVALPGATFLQAPGSANDHDLGLFAIGDAAGASTAGRTTVGPTTWRGRSTPSTSWPASPTSWPATAPSTAPPITAPPRRCMPGTPTASTSR